MGVVAFRPRLRSALSAAVWPDDALAAGAGGGAEFERANGEIVAELPTPWVLPKASTREGGGALVLGGGDEGDEGDEGEDEGDADDGTGVCGAWFPDDVCADETTPPLIGVGASRNTGGSRMAGTGAVS
jgi:hypothetical protein